MKIDKNEIVDLLIGLVGLQKRINMIDDVTESDTFTELFATELGMIQDTILSLCGVPDENTPFEALGINTDDFEEQLIEYGFCKDHTDDIIWNLSNFDWDDLPAVCDQTVIEILNRWYPDENYITKREEE